MKPPPLVPIVKPYAEMATSAAASFEAERTEHPSKTRKERKAGPTLRAKHEAQAAEAALVQHFSSMISDNKDVDQVRRH